MPLAVLEIEELLEVLTDRTKPSRVLDQFLLSDIWAKLPESASDPQVRDANVAVCPRLVAPSLGADIGGRDAVRYTGARASFSVQNHATVMSSAALRDSPEYRCRLVDA